MKKFLLLLLTLSACNSQVKKPATPLVQETKTSIPDAPIAQYVVIAYEDSHKNLWFGTLEKGIAKYNGTSLQYLTEKDGLPSNRVIGVTEDTQGMLWFTTGNGLSKFDGHTFTNYLVKENDFASNMISQYFVDSKDRIWIGTWAGVFLFNGDTFTPFPIPFPEVDTKINPDTKNWITIIAEDPQGNLWFARDGHGISKYNGSTFTHLTKKDGLHSNNVTELAFNADGSTWFAFRNGNKDHAGDKKPTGKAGLQKWSNNSFSSFPKIKPLVYDDVYEVYQDPKGNTWISTTKNGLYKYNGSTFTHYDVPISIMNILQDHKGSYWLAGAGGLYKITPQDEMVHVTTNGPWE